MENPFPWLDWITSNSGMENFFEVNTTNYSKGSMTGKYDAAYEQFDKKKIVVWSKNNCVQCVSAKGLLKSKGLEFEERNIESGNWSREQFFEANPTARTLPQVWVNCELIGGYVELRNYLN